MMIDTSNLHNTHSFVSAVMPLVMAGLQMAKGFADSAKARGQEAAANTAAKAIPQVDPRVKGFLDELRMNRRYTQMGQTAMMGYKRRMAEEAQRNYANNAIRSAGTAPGGVQQAHLRGLDITQKNLMGAAAQTEQLGNQLLGMETPIVQDMSYRKLALQQRDRDQLGFRAAQTRQDGNNAITGAMGLMAGMDPKMYGGMGQDKTVDYGVQQPGPSNSGMRRPSFEPNFGIGPNRGAYAPEQGGFGLGPGGSSYAPPQGGFGLGPDRRYYGQKNTGFGLTG